MTFSPRSILITGASSGIGRALALNFAAPDMHLALSGRNRDRLEAVATDCRAKGATVSLGVLDVRDRKRMAEWIFSVDDAHPIELAIANAGVTGGIGMGRLREHPDIVRNVIATNLIGTINTVDPLVERMCMHARGRIAVMGSIGGLRGLPACPSYSASKAAVHAYAEGLRGALAPLGVGVTIIAPGFVATGLNDDIVSPKPLLIDDARAARIIRRGLSRERAFIVFPRTLYYGSLLVRLLPRRWVDAVLAAVEVDVPEKFDPWVD
jgi:short-subunit dehydrogenase